MAEYGINLVDEYEDMSARRLAVLVRGLPPDAAVYRDDAWTRSEGFEASMIEVMDAWMRLLFQQLGGKMRTGSKPLRIERPWERRAEIEPTNDLKTIAEFFARNPG